MAEYVRVPARCLHRLPSAVSFERAALTEPCCVAYNAAVVQTRIRPGDTVAVIGPGPIVCYVCRWPNYVVPEIGDARL